MIYKIYYTYREMATVEVEANSPEEADEKFWEWDIIPDSREVLDSVDSEEEIDKIVEVSEVKE